MQLMGSFSGDVTVTRIGIRGKIHYKYNPFFKVKMVVQIRKGCAGQCEDTVKLYENVFYPSPSMPIWQIVFPSLIMPKLYIVLHMMVFLWSLKYQDVVKQK